VLPRLQTAATIATTVATTIATTVATTIATTVATTVAAVQVGQVGARPQVGVFQFFVDVFQHEPCAGPHSMFHVQLFRVQQPQIVGFGNVAKMTQKIQGFHVLARGFVFGGLGLFGVLGVLVVVLVAGLVQQMVQETQFITDTDVVAWEEDKRRKTWVNKIIVEGRSTKKHKEAQRSTKKHKEAQRSTKKHKERGDQSHLLTTQMGLQCVVGGWQMVQHLQQRIHEGIRVTVFQTIECGAVVRTQIKGVHAVPGGKRKKEKEKKRKKETSTSVRKTPNFNGKTQQIPNFATSEIHQLSPTPQLCNSLNFRNTHTLQLSNSPTLQTSEIHTLSFPKRFGHLRVFLHVHLFQMLRRSVDLHARLLVHVHHLRGPIAVVQLHALVRVALAAHTVVVPKKERKVQKNGSISIGVYVYFVLCTGHKYW
jgi:hypothetical protein